MFGVDLPRHTHQQTLSKLGFIDGHLMKPRVRAEKMPDFLTFFFFFGSEGVQPSTRVFEIIVLV